MSLGPRAAYLAYGAAVTCLSPLIVRRDAAKLAASGVAAERITERAGQATRPRPDVPPIWLHAVSVGETQSVLALAAHLAQTAPVLLTTTSASSAEMVARRLPYGCLHQFAPLDTARATTRFLGYWRPRLMVLTESELWPRQIAEAHARAIPVALVNARMSDRSIARWSRMKPLARHMTARIALALAQDRRTADGLKAMGLPGDRITVTGTLKSAAAPLTVDPAERQRLVEAIATRPIWVAASTHEGEEEAVAEAHRQLLRDRPDLLLILAPRHPDRGTTVARMLAKDAWRFARRSAGELPGPDTRIYLADTLGELGLWFDLTRVAFIGGSLVDRGGHNPVEPVQLGAHAVTGPHVTNFADIYAALIAGGAAVRIDGTAELAPAIAARIDTAPASLPKGAGPRVADIAERLLALAARPAGDPVVIAPNFKRRLSGVTSTVVRLVPLQARAIEIRATGPGLPPEVPHIPLWRAATLPNDQPRVWHARRNVEMIGGLALKHLLRKRLRLVFTSASQRRHTGLTRWLIARMDRVVATSDKSAAYLHGPASVIRHGIDTDAFRPAPDRAALRERLDLPRDATLIGCYGRIRASKGTDLFVDAMTRVLARHRSAEAIVMGRAVEKDARFLADLRDRAGLASRIRFAPEVPVDRTPYWYAALDLYVAPQRWEGFGLTPLEAMATGVPVVATRTGAFDELIVDGQTGWLVPPGDAAGLAAAVEEALADPDRLARMGAAARAHVARHFTLRGEADALVSLYRQLLR